MSARTDTERLDFMHRCGATQGWAAGVYGNGDWYLMVDGMKSSHSDLRTAIDAAMDAIEGKELDEAWKKFRMWTAYTVGFDDTKLHWEVRDGGNGHVAYGGSKDLAVLSAYRAAKKGEGKP